MTDFTDPVMDDFDILASECHGTMSMLKRQNRVTKHLEYSLDYDTKRAK